MSEYSLQGPELTSSIRLWASELGFDQTGITGVDLSADEQRLLAWLQQGRHGEMQWMERHGVRRARPPELIAGTVSVISVRMDYWPANAADADAVLAQPDLGYISRYALGRDYHKLLRTRVQRLADRIESAIGTFNYRCFSDSAPVMEKPLARNAGLGWIGKHTNLINRNAGSWFFLAEMYTDLPLPADAAVTVEHCGTCDACMRACPTGAITAAYELDARLCISYLTIEHPGSIPVELRPAMGNRIYGCDDCQLVCPWNRFSRPTRSAAFEARDALDSPRLSELFAISAQTFAQRFAGSAIRRIGHERFMRNIAVALGNAPSSPEILSALNTRVNDPSALIREHVQWALACHLQAAQMTTATTRPQATRQPTLT
ncbi:MAG: epoxyqueuosine reductase [Gammaproteobacteria bacterium]|jgi:epoxyqueuosine reductase